MREGSFTFNFTLFVFQIFNHFAWKKILKRNQFEVNKRILHRRVLFTCLDRMINIRLVQKFCMFFVVQQQIYFSGKICNIDQTITANVYSQQLQRVNEILLQKRPTLANQKGSSPFMTTADLMWQSWLSKTSNS